MNNFPGGKELNNSEILYPGSSYLSLHCLLMHGLKDTRLDLVKTVTLYIYFLTEGIAIYDLKFGVLQSWQPYPYELEEKPKVS